MRKPDIASHCLARLYLYVVYVCVAILSNQDASVHLSAYVGTSAGVPLGRTGSHKRKVNTGGVFFPACTCRYLESTPVHIYVTTLWTVHILRCGTKMLDLKFASPSFPAVLMYRWNVTRTQRRRLPANQAEQKALQGSGIRDPKGGMALLIVLFSSLGITIRQSLVELSTN